MTLSKNDNRIKGIQLGNIIAALASRKTLGLLIQEV